MNATEVLHGFFAPSSVLVVGVSDSPRNLARHIVGNLMEFRFPGAIYLIGRRPGFLYGHPIRTSFEDLPEGIGLAVILTPAPTVPDIVDRCGAKGIRYAVIQSGGFRELGEEGARIEARVVAAARRHGMRFIGPNCLGVLSPPGRMGAVFMPVKDYWRHGGVSVASQSGGVGVTYLYGLASENLGLARFASIGNKDDMDESDFLRVFDADPDTRAVALYLESIARGRAFFEALRACRKPVLVQKANRTPHSQGVAFSHTAALATDDAVVDAAIRQAGGIRVRTMHEMLSRIKALMLPAVRGPRLAVIARSGGHAVLAADAAADAGFALPEYPPEYLASIAGSFRSDVIRRGNPLDLGDLYDFEAYARILEGAAALPGFDAVVMVHEYFAVVEGEESRKLIPKAAELARRFDKPVVLVLVTDERETAQIKRLYDYPFFTSLEDALMALGAARRVRERGAGDAPAEPSPDVGAAVTRVRALARSGAREVLAEGFEVLRAAGVEVPAWALVRSTADLPVSVPFPVAAKVVSRRAVHKTEAGGVVLGLAGPEDLARTVADLAERFGPFGDGEGVLVQAMAPQGTEWIVGGRRDDVFGPIVVVGAGGVLVEVLKDTAIRLAPVSMAETREMIASLKAEPLLRGVRGAPPGDREALARLVVTVAALLHACPEVAEMDLNPCIVHPAGATVVDVRMRLVPPDPAIRP